MTEHVADEVLGQIARQQHDLFRRIREGTLDPQQVSQGIQALIEGRFQNGTAPTVPAFARDMRKEDWTLVEGFDESDPEEFSGGELEFVSLLRKGETRIFGEAMRKRALQEDANFGQRFAEYLLEHPEKIPARPDDCYYISFPRAVWRDRGGNLHVPYLIWYGERWGLSFTWLGHDWGSHDGLLRPRK